VQSDFPTPFVSAKRLFSTFYKCTATFQHLLSVHSDFPNALYHTYIRTNVKINALYTDSVRTSQRAHCANDEQRNTAVHCRGRMQRVTSPSLDVMVWVLDVASLGLDVMPSGLDIMPCRKI